MSALPGRFSGSYPRQRNAHFMLAPRVYSWGRFHRRLSKHALVAKVITPQDATSVNKGAAFRQTPSAISGVSPRRLPRRASCCMPLIGNSFHFQITHHSSAFSSLKLLARIIMSDFAKHFTTLLNFLCSTSSQLSQPRRAFRNFGAPFHWSIFTTSANLSQLR